MMLKLNLHKILAILYIINGGIETVIFNPKEMIGIVDLRLMGYYKTKQGILQHILSKYYRFKSADTLFEQFNRFINTLKKERKKHKKNIHGLTQVMKENICQKGNIR